MNAGSTARGRGRRTLFAWLVPLIVIVLAGAGLGTYFGAFYHRGEAVGSGASVTQGGSSTTGTETTTTSPASTATTSTTVPPVVDMGANQAKEPDVATLIGTARWGELPAGQFVVLLAENGAGVDAERVAAAVGGSVVGEIEFLNLYQIEFPGSSEADLQTALATARADRMVAVAAANEQTLDDIEIWGIPQTPLDDAAYQGDHGAGYDLVGVEQAWKYIQGSGLHLWGVNVGVVDTGLYKGTDEFHGDVDIDFPRSANGELTSPARDQYGSDSWEDPDGSHGTAVSGIIAADPTNTGQVGIASVLGGKLTLSVANKNAPPYGNKEVPPDPDNPAVVVAEGKSYSLGCLAAIVDQIEAGARVINCSWGNSNASPEMAAVYRRFFERMAAEHPGVLFVCSAGNDGASLDGTKRYPSGLSLPNMITVGNIMNDGTVAASSNRQNTTPGQEYEVTIAAPGDEAVRSVGIDGDVRAGDTPVGSSGVVVSGGTSMAAPHVTAAAALLLSIDPDLTAGEIKDLLTRTARHGPADLGGRTLAIDAAVLELVNEKRSEQGLAPLTAADVEKAGMVEAVAISTDVTDVYRVRAILADVPDQGTEVHIFGSYGATVDGELAQELTAPGEVVWPVVTVVEESPGFQPTIFITRKDNGASNIITIGMPDLNGHWKGEFVITELKGGETTGSTDEVPQGCEEQFELFGTILEGIIGQPIPMTMDVVADMEARAGTAEALIDLASVIYAMPEVREALAKGGDITVSNKPMPLPFTFTGNTITFQTESSSDYTMNISATVGRRGDEVVMKGRMSGTQDSASFVAGFTLFKDKVEP